MPFKANADRPHRIPKQQFRVTNWAGYDAALRERGSLPVWFLTAEGQLQFAATARDSSGATVFKITISVASQLTRVVPAGTT